MRGKPFYGAEDLNHRHKRGLVDSTLESFRASTHERLAGRRSACHGDGSFGPSEPVAELNSAAMDIQPNVRRDGRELVFASNRGGASAFGGQDIWVATRKDVNGPWSAPVHLGAAVNTAANETRPSLSWGATRLYFGRAPGAPATADIYVSTRQKIGD